jgi:hypothetical protein
MWFVPHGCGVGDIPKSRNIILLFGISAILRKGDYE